MAERNLFSALDGSEEKGGLSSPTPLPEDLPVQGPSECPHRGIPSLCVTCKETPTGPISVQRIPEDAGGIRATQDIYPRLWATFGYLLPGLSEAERVRAISVVTGVCPICWMAERGCQCFREEDDDRAGYDPETRPERS